MDEVRISKVARSAAFVRAEFASESPDGKLIGYGTDEKQSGISFGYFGVIVQHVTLDAWVVIAILGVMAAVSWFVMWTKASYFSGVERGNDTFLDMFRKAGGDPFAVDEMVGSRASRRLGNSSLYRIFRSGADEIKRRTDRNGRVVLDSEASDVIRAIMDSTMVRENQKLARAMVLLTIAISGGPFLGLLGTVVGVMITFAAIAASGDVNINAIAPGISAALLATVAGLAVAIPALFGYNYLLTRSKNITANMHVFVDEFVTRMSELYREHRYAKAAE
jgi:biopolymer transport protein ExbB